MVFFPHVLRAKRSVTHVMDLDKAGVHEVARLSFAVRIGRAPFHRTRSASRPLLSFLSTTAAETALTGGRAGADAAIAGGGGTQLAAACDRCSS